ncbi:hypothetical protein PSN45_002997 [Yamadazyma tenuis]|uniref:Importin N-terminal domain-containing protein n=1 Tax=Candida tenuis (strain ATCC 10573 / BCRC 21748 / CBS 615 / JCM 9827 / NBRC 10315 / NRRL Y-1498 / VKM Y-70) TaxID=590646 RepID=G3AXK8_CANTC|nr:uncharacterized protein CANTEDRAFT_117219 [Yamadazyma tenuis ATCC 10573]EGV66408.1 hypothetical protein CANTEDRAFT_117219 [Yamadazyma tenuis ATCC 10573]WEJ95477.1 hypothetical protein PSN45_002997 [Yamadazyma tenuis]
MDRETLLKALAGTLDASNYQLRKESEQQLRFFEQQPGFTAYLLDLCMEPEVPQGVQISATVLFKNRISSYWVSSTERSETFSIKDDEKPIIKTKLIETLVKTIKNSRIRSQLALAIHSIVNAEKWDNLNEIIKTLLSSGEVDQINAGLICLYQYTRAYRWSHLESSNPILDDITTELFPTLEVLMDNLLANDSAVSDEMMYLVVKIFKFSTYSVLPTYIQDQNNLGKWCRFQIMLINKPLPDSVMQEEVLEERASIPRIKAVKWCFGNLHRLLSRHGGGFSTRNKEDNQFAKFFLSTFVPEILKVYWNIIENWSAKRIWLSEGSLYHMISFLEQLIENDAWSLISGEMEAILKHVILPPLQATDETVELYEDDPEEYVRRFFDINRESNTSDVASISFVYRLSSKKFAETSSLILGIISDIFDRRAKNRNDVSIAKEVEGALRVLATISYKLDKKQSPVHGQIDQLIYAYVYPELSEDSIAKAPYLTARACDTLAMFIYTYQDTSVLQQIFTGVINCFQKHDHLPIRLTAVDALRTLVDNDAVADHIAPQVPQLMGSLIEMTKTFESDTLTSVMESFVEKFASSLEPYANDLSARLTEQFLRTANELLEMQSGSNSGNVDIDKEYQASGILKTITTLVVAMSTSPSVASSLEHVLKDSVVFVIQNAQIAFLPEVLEILESLIFATQRMSPLMWELYQVCMDSFDTYAYEFFDNFSTYFESVIFYGFTSEDVTIENKQVQSLITVCFEVLRSEFVEPIFAHSAFELLELIILALNQRFKPFLVTFLPEIFQIFDNLKAQEAFDGYMLHQLSIARIFFATSYVDPITTLQFLNEKQFTPSFFKLWIEHSDDFQSVHGCKLQILSCIAFLCDGELSLIQDQDLIGEITDLLISNLEVLPHAIKTRQDIQSKEYGVRQFLNEDEDGEYTGEYLADDYDAEAELEAMKQTPIDNINVYESFVTKMQLLQQQKPQAYQEIVERFSDDQKIIVNRVFETFNKIRAQS